MENESMLYQKNKFLKKRSLFKIFSKSGDKKKIKTNIKYNNLKKITIYLYFIN